jgi:hypothetical protein
MPIPICPFFRNPTGGIWPPKSEDRRGISQHTSRQQRTLHRIGRAPSVLNVCSIFAARQKPGYRQNFCLQSRAKGETFCLSAGLCVRTFYWQLA